MKEPFVPKRDHVFQEETSLQRVLSLIFWNPDAELSLTELAKKARVSKSSASTIVDWLKKTGIASVNEKGKVFRIRANMQNQEYTRRRIAHHLMALFESNFLEYLEKQFPTARAIILFGSFRKGDDIATSDIDIAVEMTEDKDIHIVRPPYLEAFEKLFGREIEIHAFNRKRVDINVFNSIANGIVLSGFLEVKP